MEELLTFKASNNKRRDSYGLSGNLPESLGLLSNIYEFDVSDNSIVGQIPASLGECTDLAFLYLQDNGLEGDVPSELGNLFRIKSMNLIGNNLQGEVPQDLCNVEGAEIRVDCSVSCDCCTEYEC